MLLRYHALHLGDAIGCSWVRPEVALKALNRKFGEFLFWTFCMNHAFGVQFIKLVEQGLGAVRRISTERCQT